MRFTHQQGLYVAYGAAMLGWFVASRVWAKLWPKPSPPRFARPWREVGYALLACVGVVALGQLYQHVWKLSAAGLLAPIAGAINHLLIFSPIGLLLLIRGQTLDTAWVPRSRVVTRIVIGLGIAGIAILTYCFSRGAPDEFFPLLKRIYRFEHFEHLAQVFFEDIAIAVLMVRFSAALRRPWLAAILVGALFAGGHIPVMIAEGAVRADLLRLVWDFVLCAAVVMVAQRSADIWWFWCVHFAMDMTQF